MQFAITLQNCSSMNKLKQHSHLLILIEKIVKSNGINDHDIKKIETNQKGEGFLSELFFVTVSDKITKKEFDFVIKSAMEDEQLRQSIPIRKIFVNEIFGYSTLFPLYEKFLKSKRLNVEEYNFLPKCYYSSIEDRSEVIILENLRPQGFEPIDRQLFFNGNSISLIFETFGRLHGISFAYKDQFPEEYKKLASKLTTSMLDLMQSQLLKNEIGRLSQIIEENITPKLDLKIQEKLEKYRPSEINKTFVQTMITENQNSIILHGDCWSNNFLFKYNETREPIDMRLVDLQLMHYGNPVCDLSYCLYSSSLKDVFNHLDDYLSIYHRSLSDTLRKLGSAPERVLTLENLKTDWRQYAKFGFILGTFVMQLKIKSNSTDLSDVDFQEDVHIDCDFNMEKYCSNLTDVILHLDKYGVL